MERRLFPVIMTIALSVASARGSVLTFSGDICTTSSDGSGGPGPCISNGAYISQGYGDTANVNVTYFVTSPNGNSTMTTWIDPNVYSDLGGVAYGFFGATYASITMTPSPGMQVTLNSFNLGTAPPNVSRNTNIRVIDLATNTQVFSTSVLVGATAALVSPGVTSSTGLEIRYDPDTFNVALDNLDFDVAASPGGPAPTVPEPASLALAGLGCLALMLRGRWLTRHRRGADSRAPRPCAG